MRCDKPLAENKILEECQGPMKGIDPRFTELPDYILKRNAQIWEGRDIAALDWHYGDDLTVRDPAGFNIAAAQ